MPRKKNDKAMLNHTGSSGAEAIDRTLLDYLLRNFNKPQNCSITLSSCTRIVHATTLIVRGYGMHVHITCGIDDPNAVRYFDYFQKYFHESSGIPASEVLQVSDSVSDKNNTRSRSILISGFSAQIPNTMTFFKRALKKKGDVDDF